MTDSVEAKRVLIVGAGFRAANNFLPAFALLPDLFKVVGIVARSTKRSEPLSKLWNVPVFRSLAEIDANRVDIVAVTIPTDQNRIVLENILKWNPSILLAMDTPVARNYREFRDLEPLLRRFPAVVVAEDFMNFPQFELSRRAAREGLLGRIQSVTLYNTGYAYHGLALLRSFADLAPVVGCRRTLLGSYSSVLGYRFGSGMRGYIVGPYRQSITGGIVVEGSKAIVTQAPEDVQFAQAGKRETFVLAPVTTDGILSAFIIEGTPYRVDTPEIASMLNMPFSDQTLLNVLKNIGLTKIFSALLSADYLNRKYGFENALYDSFASRLANRGLLPFDPFFRVDGGFMAIPRLLATRSFVPRFWIKPPLRPN
jgi:hypothetical protein